MAIDFYRSEGDPCCWRVALALEFKRLPYVSHALQLDLQEHKAPQMLALNFRGQLPVLRDQDYVVFESLAILYYLDRKYPDPPIFGRSPEESGVIMRVICEYLSYAEPPLKRITGALLADRHGDARGADALRESNGRAVGESLAEAMHRIAGEARTIEQRLARSDWVVGETFSAADMVIYPDVRLLLHALQRPEAHELAARFLPTESNYPAIGRWLERVASLPGHERTWPTHWR
ncbi:MAG TPA: glutathione S-transferase family protein [Steroidobacteraceae bacterium]|nr:glutathione S-transferase family protein [Steroidobacteraceae bacterium]